jgi:hypothetical protein
MVYRVMMDRPVMTMMTMTTMMNRMMRLRHRKSGHGKKNDRSQ